MAYTQTYQYLQGGFAPASSPYALQTGEVIVVDGTPNHTRASIDWTATTRVDDEDLERLLERVSRPLQKLDPLEALPKARSLNLTDRIVELLHQLDVRYGLHRSIQGRLKSHILETRNTLLNLQPYGVPFDASMDKRRSTLESVVEHHYTDRNREELDFWKDQRELREQLIELLNEYRMAAWRNSLLIGLSYKASGQDA